MYLDKDIESEIRKEEYLGDTGLNEILERLKCVLALLPQENPQKCKETPLTRAYDKAYRALYRFYDYWVSLYGTGLEIANWHLNGELEPFDNFFESAVEYAESEESK